MLEPIHAINSYDSCYLLYINEPADNHLRLIIAKAGVLRQQVGPLPGIPGNDVQYGVLEPMDEGVELNFDWYIAYSVINEGYASVDESEIYQGKLFRVYTKSHFLDYITKATFATSDYPGPYIHYGIVTLNHVIDVVSTVEPAVKILSRAELEPYL